VTQKIATHAAITGRNPSFRVTQKLVSVIGAATQVRHVR
jgi:hypothetical protein